MYMNSHEHYQHHNHQPWVSVAAFEQVKDGRILETFFRDRDIDARTYNDKLLQLFLFLCPPHVTYRVQVRKDQFDKATHAMDDGHPPILEKAIHCPSCGSLRVNYPQMTRRFFLPTVLLHLGIIFRVIEHECYCENCHLTWNLSKDAASRMRAPRPFFPFNK